VAQEAVPRRGLAGYVPSVAAEWAEIRGSERWQVVDGTLCLVDISGSTALFERLAAQGRVAAEELTDPAQRRVQPHDRARARARRHPAEVRRRRAALAVHRSRPRHPGGVRGRRDAPGAAQRRPGHNCDRAPPAPDVGGRGVRRHPPVPRGRCPPRAGGRGPRRERDHGARACD